MESAITGLIIAFILSWFGFNNIFIEGCKEFFNLNITIYGYYFSFFLFGLIVDIINLTLTLRRR